MPRRPWQQPEYPAKAGGPRTPQPCDDRHHGQRARRPPRPTGPARPTVGRPETPAGAKTLVIHVPRHPNPPRQPLNGAPCRRLGNVLAPRGFLVGGPAPELLAVADPLDAVVLHEDHLHRAGRKSVRAEHRHRRLQLGPSSKPQCHRTSIIPLGCGLSVDYLWVCLKRTTTAHRPGLPAPGGRPPSGNGDPF